MKQLPDAALQQHIAILGKTRSGKSTVMRGLVEGLLDRQMPVCIVDPKGDWWGLKLAKDGKRPGYPVVIFGGEHADVPINEHAGAHVAEIFATGNRPCLIDMGGWMVGARTRFWIAFASTLFKLTRGMRWLVVDEVHNFAPKGKIMDPDAGKALHWTNRLASEGLGRGLPMIFASQRPQKVHNDTLTSAETLIAMRVLHPSDRGAISDWIKGCGDLALGAKVLDSLAQMARGEGWAWSPEIGFGPERVKFPMFKTYDSFRPQTVEDTKALTGWAQVDLEDVKTKMQTVIMEASKNDPAVLHKRIAELERAARASPAAMVVPDLLLKTKNEGKVEGYRSACADLREDVLKFHASVDELLNLARNSFSTTLQRIEVAARRGPIQAATASQARQATSAPAPVQKQATAAPRAAGAGISREPADTTVGNGGLRRMMIALAQRPNGMTRRALGVRSGMSSSSGTFSTYLAKGRTSGWIDGSGHITITDSGLRALGPYDPIPTGKGLLEYWKSELGNSGASRLLEVLSDVYPKTLSRDAAAEAAGMSPGSGTFSTYLAKLRTLELVTGSRELIASEEFFS